MSGVIYYALGGGHGHALRGIAVLRRLREQLPNRPAAMIAPRRLAGWVQREGIRGYHPASDSPSRAELATLASEALSSERAGRLLVDVFPRGILGELGPLLADLPQPPWLVTRHVRPEYYLETGVRLALESHYQRAFWCEEAPGPLRELALAQERVGPVLVRRAGERLSREDARRALGAGREERLLLALGTGERERQRDLLRLLLKIRQHGVSFRLVFVSDELPRRQQARCSVVPLYPALSYLPGADLVVAGGGYASFHETVATGVATVYMPQARRYDDQHWRVQGRPTAEDPAQLERAVRSGLASSPRPLPQPAEDGAAQIAAALAGAAELSPTKACT